MTKHLLLLMVVMALVPGCAHSMAARSGDGAAAVIETGDPRECYTDMFNSMIKAVGNDHLYRLVDDAKPYAEDVFNAWAGNINSAPTYPTDSKLQQLLVNAAAELPAKTYRFPQLITKRLNGQLATERPSADLAIDALVAARIGFPLFDKNFDPNISYKERLEVAANFSKDVFKRLSWEKLYVDTKYGSRKYKASDIAFWISQGQEFGVIPYLNDDVWNSVKCPPNQGNANTTSAGNNRCCCNVVSHTGYYRTCKDNAPGQNCTGSPNCVLGSQNCSAGHSHP